MSRLFNFSAGPAMLPIDVLEQAQKELLDWQGTGMSVMEMSHRGKEFMSIAQQAEADLRDLMAIPDNYKVLFLQGGASSQFSLIPMNLASNSQKAAYLVTGSWSKKAVAEAKKICAVDVLVDTSDVEFSLAPDENSYSIADDYAYFHYTPNETIQGVEFPYVPDSGSVPLVADMSSTILSRAIDVSRFAVIYAGAQKNIGPAGLTLVIIREDLLARCSDKLPSMFNYKVLADAESMYNTPSTYAWYFAGLVFMWLKKQGGVAGMGKRNQAKAEKLYKVIDDSDFYANPVRVCDRSWMNVPFTLADASMDVAFLEQAKTKNLVTLKGHRSVGGMRASIYNAMPEQGIDDLVSFMQEFEQQNLK